MIKNKPTKSFEELLVWKKAHQFVLEVYSITRSFPKNEMFGLTSQFRRAAISIAANISEGYKRRGKADKVRFMNISQASIEECRYYLRLSKDLDYEYNNNLLSNLKEISKMLEAYINSILTSK
jgi:four helix bundle protein